MVDRCLCERKSFTELLAMARERGIDDAKKVGEITGCGRRCGLCEPFISYMLATGVTRIPYPCPKLPGPH